MWNLQSQYCIRDFLQVSLTWLRSSLPFLGQPCASVSAVCPMRGVLSVASKVFCALSCWDRLWSPAWSLISGSETNVGLNDSQWLPSGRKVGRRGKVAGILGDFVTRKFYRGAWEIAQLLSTHFICGRVRPTTRAQPEHRAESRSCCWAQGWE